MRLALLEWVFWCWAMSKAPVLGGKTPSYGFNGSISSHLWFDQNSLLVLNFTVLACFSSGSSSSGVEVSQLVWLVGDGDWAVWGSLVLLADGVWEVPGLGSGITGFIDFLVLLRAVKLEGKVHFSEQLKYLGSRFCNWDKHCFPYKIF